MNTAAGDAILRSVPAEIPAECFNLFRLAQRRCGGSLEFALPGLPGNYVRATEREWRCWNRRLRTDLLSWQGFQTTARRALHEPVACTLTVHHPYSRTVVHRVHDAAADYLRKLLDQHRAAQRADAKQAPSEYGQVLRWPGGR